MNGRKNKLMTNNRNWWRSIYFLSTKTI